jgi:hypothetical protein
MSSSQTSPFAEFSSHFGVFILFCTLAVLILTQMFYCIKHIIYTEGTAFDVIYRVLYSTVQ